MEYRRFGDTIIVRIDRGEEITAMVREVALQEKIKLATINAIGALNDFTVGVFKVDEKKFYPNHFQGTYEIVSLTGNITTKDGEFYQHLHMSAGDENGAVVGGHLSSATVSATCEMVIRLIDGEVERSFSDEVGLNLFRFI